MAHFEMSGTLLLVVIASLRNNLPALAVRYGLAALFVSMCVFLGLTRNNFATDGNIRTILLTSAVAVIIAVPLGMLLQSGGIDFSVGSTLGVSVVAGGRFMADYGWNPLVASIAVIALAAAIGAINGLLCARWKFSPIVVTIGMLFLLRGVAFVLSGSEVRRSFGRSFSYLGRSRWVVLDIPTPVLVAALWSGILLTLWYRTTWGRHAHAGGIDEEASIQAGIAVDRVRFRFYVLTAVAAAIGGLIQLSRLDSAPPVTGQNLELEVLTAVLLGGVAFAGGFGSVANVILGVLFLNVLGNGLIQYRVDPNWSRVVEGAVLVASAGFQIAIVNAANRPQVAIGASATTSTVAAGAHDRPLPDRSRPTFPPNAVPALDVRDVVKRFGSLTALDGASLKVHPGEIVALLGDNGAGKSTLVKGITGVHQFDAGELVLDGTVVTPKSPADARRIGVEAVHQSLGVVGLFNASQNLFLGRELLVENPIGKRLGWIDRAKQRSATADALAKLRVRIPNLDAPVLSLSGGQRQSVAVTRSSIWDSSIVVMDEPTAALGVEQSAEVLSLIERLANEGKAVIVVTHDMPQVLQISDRAVVLRHGQVVADEVVDEEMTVERLVGLITGAVVSEPHRRSPVKVY